ncbi:hypothetical protein BJY52DRAFT_400764 [Lactarius psammicola]|nr:hypothetical protein BJY52DRAFT_400764 [Lactarius psammicola]
MSNDDDAGFLSLAPNLRSRIDNAFHTASASDQRGSSTFIVGLTHDAPGGFLLDDDDNMAGGFLPPSPPAVVGGSGNEREGDERPSYIPLSRIPHALQLLDLSPDDEEVLAVFRNAATGWEDDHISASRSTRRGHSTVATSEESDETEECVSLRDWRAVCAALMDDGADEEGAKEGGDADVDDENAGDIDQNSSSESSCESSDEYRDTEAMAKSRKRPRKSTSTSTAGHKATRKARPRKTQSTTPRRGDSVSASAAMEITPRQRRECLQAFLLFFPGVPEDVAKLRRLGVRELSTAATVLNEKIKTEEMIEMLDAFSTSPDKTMGLSDFEKMMVAARLA